MTQTKNFVPFALTVCGIEELGAHCEIGVSHVLSILDPGHPLPPAVAAIAAHDRLELRFNDVIETIPGFIAPARGDVERLLEFGDSLLREPAASAHLLVHCHMGISRSTAAMTLMLTQARADRPARESFAEVLRIRPHAWPNLRMIELGDELLDRKGELVDTVRAHYRDVIARKPEIVPELVAVGRGREVLHGPDA